MKFLLLKTLLLRKQKDEGFTLPIVIAIGLVMVLLSAVNLVQSGEENLNALSQRGSADALAVAEIGAARYRDLLNNNRVLAVYNSNQWLLANTYVSNQVCTAGIFGTGGWADTSSNTGRRNVTIGGNNIGDYRLISYEYDRDNIFGDNNNNGTLDDLESPNTPDNNIFSQREDVDTEDDTEPNPPPKSITDENDSDDDGEADTKGILTVQGRDTTGSVAQIRVEIPIGVNIKELPSGVRIQELTNLSPALWVEQDDLPTPGTININSDGTESDGTTRLFNEADDGNVVLYKPATSSSDGCDNPDDLPGTTNDATTISNARRLPPVLVEASLTGSKRTLNGDIDTEIYTGSLPNGLLTTYPVNHYDSSTKKIVLGSTLDDLEQSNINNLTGSEKALNNITVNGQAQKRYQYTTGTSSLVLDNGQAIVADGTSRVILHVGGNLEIDTTGGTVRLVNSQHSSQAANGITRAGIARYLEIHVEGNLIIEGTGTVDITGLVRVKGNVDIRDNSTVNVIGSIWTNGWEKNSGTLNIDTDQYTDTIVSPAQTSDEYEFYSITPNRTPAPKTYKPSGWEREEATN